MDRAWAERGGSGRYVTAGRACGRQGRARRKRGGAERDDGDACSLDPCLWQVIDGMPVSEDEAFESEEEEKEKMGGLRCVCVRVRACVCIH